MSTHDRQRGRVLTVPEFIVEYRQSRTRTYKLINEGSLVARRIGGRTMILRDDAEMWANALPTYPRSKRHKSLEF